MQYRGREEAVLVREPYLVAAYQVHGLMQFVAELAGNILVHQVQLLERGFQMISLRGQLLNLCISNMSSQSIQLPVLSRRNLHGGPDLTSQRVEAPGHHNFI